MRDVRREGCEALVMVDMSVSVPDGGGDVTPAPDTAAAAATTG